MQKQKIIFIRIFFIFFIIFYEILTIMFQFLPPLIGLFFVYAVVLKYEKEKFYQDYNLWWYFAIFFLLFSEEIHGFELFSVGISFVIFYYFIFDYLLENFKFRNATLVLIVFGAYFLTFMISDLILYIKQDHGLNFSWHYLFYPTIESFFAILFFRDKIL